MTLSEAQFDLDRKTLRTVGAMCRDARRGSRRRPHHHARQSAGQRARRSPTRAQLLRRRSRPPTPTRAVRAVVITGANGLFSGGADINDFNAEPDAGDEDDPRRRSRRSSAARRPTSRRIDGNCARRRRSNWRWRATTASRLAGAKLGLAGDQARPLAGRRRNAALAAA